MKLLLYTLAVVNPLLLYTMYCKCTSHSAVTCNPNAVRKLEVVARPHVSELTCVASSRHRPAPVCVAIQLEALPLVSGPNVPSPPCVSPTLSSGTHPIPSPRRDWPQHPRLHDNPKPTLSTRLYHSSSHKRRRATATCIT